MKKKAISLVLLLLIAIFSVGATASAATLIQVEGYAGVNGNVYLKGYFANTGPSNDLIAVLRKQLPNGDWMSVYGGSISSLLNGPIGSTPVYSSVKLPSFTTSPLTAGIYKVELYGPTGWVITSAYLDSNP
ncbi:hypothetical protein ACFQZE_15530 [Paenibacillus sp. GCM10027627]|uniref:hypothetical protein n=1 Tax=unclassified Paenibacillus TaxID=185978 RepID=UPI00362D7693